MFVLDPRREKGGDKTIINDWNKQVYEHIAKKWQQIDIQQWMDDFKGNCQLLNEKLKVVKSFQSRSVEYLERSLSTINNEIPVLYMRVLELLREADASGLWPTTTLARQKVIVDATSDTTTTTTNTNTTTTTNTNTTTNDTTTNLQGGGSFTLGCLPKNLLQPKSNSIFPKLLRESFLLERRLLPNRPPSSTIAVNRHCQFRPHRDIGLGNGQSDSLIFAMGNFFGGELLVENEVHDIRYKPLEFNGWQCRHSTLPFVGERYSLVFFSPFGINEEDMFWLKDIEM